MMEKIRTAANSIVLKIIFGVIILSFVFAGVGGLFSVGQDDKEQFIAKVDGEGLSRMTFENAVSAAIRQHKLNEQQTDQIVALRQAVLRQQIENQLVHRLAERLSISPTNEQIKTYIRHEPYFLENGQFNNERYLSLLAANRLTPDEYAESIRSLMRQQQLLQLVVYSDFILPVETQMDDLVGQKRTIETAIVTPESLGITKKTFDEKALRVYYDAHPQQFTLPTERIKLHFVRIARDDLAKTISVSKEALDTYYQQHKNKYLESAKVAYSVIETEDKVAAQAIHDQLMKGVDFGALAAEKSLYPMQRQSKGVLGWFEPEDVPSTLKQAQLQKAGDISVPLRQEDGHYLIVRLDKKRSASTPPLVKIEQQVRTDMIQDLTDSRMQKSESTLQSLVDQALSLAEIAKRMSVPLEKSTWLTPEDKPFAYAALSEQIMPHLESKEMSSLIGPVYVDEAQGVYVVQIDGVRSAGLQPFETVKSDVQRRVQTQDQQRRFTSATQYLVQALQHHEANAIKSVSFSDRRTVDRREAKMDRHVLNMVYNLVPSQNGQPVFGAAYLPTGRAVIASLLSVENQKTKQGIEGALFYQNIMDTQHSLANALLSKADITLLTDQAR